MQVRGRPINRASLGTAVHGAAEAVRGFQSAEEFQAEQQRKKRAELMQQQELQQRQQEIDNRAAMYGQRAQQWSDRQAALDAKQKQAQGERAATENANQLALKSLRAQSGAAEQSPWGQAAAGMQQALHPGSDPMQQQAQDPNDPIPPEFRAELDNLQNDTAMDPDEKARRITALAGHMSKGIETAQVQHFGKKLLDDAAFWNTQQALGLQVDFTGDGKEDPVSAVPEYVASIAQKYGADAADAAYQQIKTAFSTEKANKERRFAIGQQEEANFAQQATAMPPESHVATRVVLDSWHRGDYGTKQDGETLFKQDLAAAKGGLVPLTENGKRVNGTWVTPEQRAQHEMGVRQAEAGADPNLQRVKAYREAVQPFVGPFKYDPLDKERTMEQQHADYLRTLDATASHFGLGGIGPSQPPSRAGVLTNGRAAAAPVDAPPAKREGAPGEAQNAGTTPASDPIEALTPAQRARYDSATPEQQAEIRKRLGGG